MNCNKNNILPHKIKIYSKSAKNNVAIYPSYSSYYDSSTNLFQRTLDWAAKIISSKPCSNCSYRPKSSPGFRGI